MTNQEVFSILKSVLRETSPHFDLPRGVDWELLERKFNCQFSDDFQRFMTEVCKFSFPGDVLNVRETGFSNGNDSIARTYDNEISTGNWKPDLIPFYSIGNGDYFCLSSNEGKGSGVYYSYHEDRSTKKYSESFDKWMRALPDFLR